MRAEFCLSNAFLIGTIDCLEATVSIRVILFQP